MSDSPLSTVGKEELKDGAACTAGNPILPMFASPVNPKMPRACRQRDGAVGSSQCDEPLRADRKWATHPPPALSLCAPG